MTYRFWGIVLLAAASLPLVAQEPPTPPASAPASQSTETEALRAENARLKAQLEVLQKQTTTTATKPAATRPAESAPRFRTMQEILAKVPPDLQPKPTADWPKYTLSKYAKWVEEQMVGLQVDLKLPLARCDVMRAPNITGRPDSAWAIYGQLGSQHFTYFGSENAWSIPFPLLKTDEATARRWEKLKLGTLLPVRGVIRGVSVTRTNYDTAKLPQLHYRFELRDLQIELPAPNPGS